MHVRMGETMSAASLTTCSGLRSEYADQWGTPMTGIRNRVTAATRG